MRDRDEIISAEKLIDDAQAGRIGEHPVNRIPLPCSDGFQVFGFDIPGMCKQWCPRIREGAIDSACMRCLCSFMSFVLTETQFRGDKPKRL